MHTYRDALSSVKNIKHCESGVNWSTVNCFSDSGNGLDVMLEVIWLYRATCKHIYIILIFLLHRNHKREGAGHR